MLHVTTAGCVTEETAESRIPMKPSARNCRPLDWQECFGVLRRQFIEFDIPGFSEKGLLRFINWSNIWLTPWSEFELSQVCKLCGH